jgi:hypothetical protein
MGRAAKGMQKLRYNSAILCDLTRFSSPERVKPRDLRDTKSVTRHKFLDIKVNNRHR